MKVQWTSLSNTEKEQSICVWGHRVIPNILAEQENVFWTEEILISEVWENANEILKTDPKIFMLVYLDRNLTLVLTAVVDFSSCGGMYVCVCGGWRKG